MDGWPLVVVLLLAALTRIPYLFMSAYSHDELSALYRIQVAHFGDLFSHEGLTDAHPPLVQVFLYAYTSLFGTQEWVVRLPFVLMGIGSVYLVYRIGKNFYCQEAGLLTAAILAVSQLFIFHALMARPYSPGLFFVLLFTEKWLQCFYNGATTRKNVTLYILYGWMAFFTHHFCTLHIFLTVMLGAMAIPKTQWKNYVKINALLLLVSLPVFYVIRFQLQFKGIGTWLAAPEGDFLLKFFRYFFHYSNFYLWAVVGVTLVAAVFYFRKVPATKRFYIPVLMAVFLLVYLIAYAYSVYRAPLLQFSLLQFSLPFFLLGIFQVFHVIRNIYFTGIIAFVFVALGLVSLYHNREQHQLMHDFPYRAFAGFCAPYQNKNVLIITSDRTEFLSRYMNTGKVLSTYGHEKPARMVADLVREKNPDLVISGNTDFMTYSMLRSYYPHMIERREGFMNNFFVLDKTNRNRRMVSRETPPIPLPVSRQKVNLNAGTLYFSLADTLLEQLGQKKNTQLWFRAKVQSAGVSPAILVFELHENDSLKHWFGCDLYVRPDTLHPQECFATYDFSEELKKTDLKKTHIKLYLWNSLNLKSEFTQIEWGLMEPNRKFYGLTEDIAP